MARPAKSIKAGSRHNTQEDIAVRDATEKKLRGADDDLVAPEYFTDSQIEIFDYIVRNLKGAEILGNLDTYVLAFTCVTIDKVIEIDTRLNEVDMVDDPIAYSKLVSTRSTLSKDLFRCFNELSLSPQARAKISIANVKAIKESKNPLLSALEDL